MKMCESLNRDFCYQLTVIGSFAQAVVQKEIHGNEFQILTDQPDVKVSWQITGVRRDPYAEMYRIPTVVEKEANNKGKYLYPEVYGKSLNLNENMVVSDTSTSFLSHKKQGK